MSNYNSAQDVLDAYYQQEALIEKDGDKILNHNFKSLVEMVEEYGQQRYKEGKEFIMDGLGE